MSEQNRKTLRSFYCRDYLWELFEVMTRDLGCSMDYLINEAMRHYARSRNYSLTSAQQGQPPAGGQQSGFGGFSTEPPAYTGPSQSPTGSFGAPPPAPAQPANFQQPAQPAQPGGRGFEHRTFERMPAARQQPFNANQSQRRTFQPSEPARPSAPPPPPVPKAPPAPPSPPPAAPAAAASPAPASSGRQVLNLIFNGQRYPVSKDKFIIGRASQMTDLTIRDGNISRKHCAIIYRGGHYYIKDLDSTNGIEYKGNRIDSKKIDEGDVFHVCDYELRFSYR